MSDPLKVHDIIDQAINENRLGERILLGFAGLFVGLATVVLVMGVLSDSIVAYAGVVESLLFVPAIWLVLRIRSQNMALRILEIPLRKAKTADEAEWVLIEFFRSAHGVKNADKDDKYRGDRL